MKFKKFIIQSALLSSLLMLNKNISAEETSVYCSDKNRNWHWLNEGKARVKGTWGTKIISDSYFYSYFILDNGLIEIWKLKFKCNQEFGKNFIYAQPANSIFSVWAPFALNDNSILDGHKSYILLNEYY
jgi:hypothetical protein